MKLSHFADAKNHIEGKIVAVVVAFAMVFAFSHADSWLKVAVADDSETVAIDAPESNGSGDDGKAEAPAPTADNPFSAPADEPADNQPSAPSNSTKPAADDPADQIAKFKMTVDAKNAKVLVNGTVVDTKQVKEGKDVTFTVDVNQGRVLDAVYMENASGQTLLYPAQDGTYTIPSSDIAGDFKVVVKTHKDESAAAEEPSSGDDEGDDSNNANETDEPAQGDEPASAGDDAPVIGGEQTDEPVAPAQDEQPSFFSSVLNFFAAPASISNEGDKPEIAHRTVTVEFFYEQGGMAAPAWSADILIGDDYSVKVPVIEHYTATINDNSVEAVAGTVQPVEEGAVDEGINIQVIYKADPVNYTVITKTEVAGNPGTYAEAIETRTAKYGDEVTAEVNPPVGYYVSHVPGTVVLASDNVSLTIEYFLEDAELHYQSNGGSYIRTYFGKYFDQVDLSSIVPTRAGYEFAGWYTDADCNNKAPSVVTLDSDSTTLYAKWTSQTVQYTVSYWAQNANDSVDSTDEDKKYDFVYSEQRTAWAGDKVSGSDDVDRTISTMRDGTGAEFVFTYNANKTDSSVEVKGDGSTVVNVYYDRWQVTVEWYDMSDNLYRTVSGLYGGALPEGAWDGSRSWSWDSVRKSDGSVNEGGVKQGGHVASLLTSLDIMMSAAEYWNYATSQVASGEYVTKFYQVKDYKNTRYYWNEQWDGSFKLDLITKSDGWGVNDKYVGYTKWKLKKTDAQNGLSGYSTLGGTAGEHDFDSWDSATGGSFDQLHNYLVSKLKSYELSFWNYDHEITADVKQVKYTTPMYKAVEQTNEDPDIYKAAPQRPASLESYYEFTGWYADAACTVPFNFMNSTMPHNNLRIYAGWKKQKFTVTFVTGVDGLNLADQTVLAGNTITVDDIFDGNVGYRFEGWYTDPHFNNRFDENEPLTSDVTLHAKWAKITTTTYTVKYVDEQGEDVFPSVTYTGTVGDTVGAVAKAHESLVADKVGETIELTDVAANNVIEFVYKASGPIWYQVNHINAATGDVIASEKPDNPTDARNVVAYAKNYAGYVAFARYVSQALVAADTKADAANNTINLYYLPVVTVTAASGEKVYDGTALEAAAQDPAYTVAAVAGEAAINQGDFAVTVTGSQTEVGTSDSSIAKVDVNNAENKWAEGFSGKTAYSVKTVNGKLKVTKRPVTVTITGHEAGGVYKGSAYTAEGYDTVVSDALYSTENIAFGGTASVSRVEVGISPMGLAEDQFSNANQNFEVTFVVNDGKVEVTPVADEVVVTIVGHNNLNNVYNGEAYEVLGYNVSIDNPLYTIADFTFNGTASASQINVGEKPMGLEAEQFVNANNNFTNVKFVVTDGKVSVVSKSITVDIAGHTVTHVYDGNTYTAKGYDVTIHDDINKYTEGDFTFNGPVSVSRTEVGKTDMGLKAEQFTNNNGNYTVTFNVVDGYAQVTPITDEVVVQVKGNQVTAVYDGDAHVASGYEVVGISNDLYTAADFGLAEGAEATASRTDYGKTDMGLTPESFVNNSGNFTNVVFEVVEDGYAQVTPRNVTVTIVGNNDTKTYDGAEHTVTGYEVTEISDNLYKVDYIQFNGTASASRTDEGTTDMELAASQFKNSNANFNVAFQVTDGYMTIVPVDGVVVKVKGDQVSATYDGESHTATGYTVVEIVDPSGKYTAADFGLAAGVEATASRTDHGKTDMGLTPESFVNNNANFKNVTFVIEDGYVDIAKRPVTVTIVGNNDTKTYDGTEHTVTGYETTVSDSLYAKSNIASTATAVAKRTVVGTTNMNLAADQFSNTNDNFDVTFNVTDGYVIVTPVKETVTVTIVGNNDTKTYDATEHIVTGYKVTGISNSLYAETDFTFNGTAEAKRTPAGTTDMGLAEAQFVNVNANFENVKFEVTDGYMIVNPLDVTVTIVGNNDTVTYDGTEHTVTGFEVEKSSSDLYTKSDYRFDGIASASRTDVGTTDMGLTAEQFANTNNSGNFNVTFNVTGGYIAVNPIEDPVVVTVKGNNVSGAYKAEAYTAEGYDVEIDNDLYTEEDFTFAGTATASQTDVGTDYMGLKVSDFTNISDNFANVIFVVEEDGSATVTPLDVTVTIVGNHETVTYDGTEHTVTGFEVEKSSSPLYTADDYAFNGEATASRTDAGTTKMGLDKAQFVNINDSGNFNVTFDVTDGYITINPIEDLVTVKITGANKTEQFDTNEHVVSGYAFEPDNDLYTQACAQVTGASAEATASQINVGTDHMGLDAADFTNISKNFTNVKFEVVEDGYVTVTPAPVVVKANNNGKVYGNPDPKLDATVTGVLDDTQIEYIVERAAGEEVGEYPIAASGDKTQGNYEVTYQPGTFTITKAGTVIVTINGNSDTKVYNSEEQKVEGYTVSINDPSGKYTEDDFAFNGEAVAKGTDVNPADEPYAMGLTEGMFVNTNENYESVQFIVNDGTLNITPAAVTVTISGNSATKVYNGEEQKVEGYTVSINDPSGKYTEDDFAFNGEAVAKGTDVNPADEPYAMGLTEGMFTNGNDNFTVIFKVNDGKLNITPVTDQVVVTIKGNTATEIYNGKDQKAEGYTVEISDPLYSEADFTFSGTAVAAGKDVDSYAMGLKAEQFANVNDNFTNVKFVIEDGGLTITPAPLTITTPNAQKVYDGTALTAKGSIVGFVNNETATFATTGTQTLVGQSDNTYTLVWDGTAVESNYSIAETIGKLKVTDGTEPGDDPVKDDLVVNKIHEAGAFDLGDTVTFTITATNIYDEAKTITFAEIDGVTLTQSVFDAVEPGATVTTTATYTITEADILAGTFVNTVTAKMGNIEKQATDTVTPANKDPKLTVTKTSDVAEGTKAVLGQTITYTVTVKNVGNVTIKNIKVTDSIENAVLVEETNIINELEPKGEAKLHYTYVVTEADVLAGNIHNEATAAGSDPTDKPVEETGTTDDPTEDVNGKIAVKKVATGANVTAAGQTITYKVSVANIGNVTVSALALADDKAPADVKFVNKANQVVTSVAPGETVFATYEYTVTQDEMDAGKVENTATVTGTVPPTEENPNGTVTDSDDEEVTTTQDPENPDEPVIVQAPGINVQKTFEIQKAQGNDKAGVAQAGDVITYIVTVANTGNVTLKDIVVTDEMEGLEQVGDWAAFDLAPTDEAKVLTATYTVKQSDIDEGRSLANLATATAPDPTDPGDDPENPKPPVTDEDDTNPPSEKQKPSLNVVKTADKTSDLKAGDVVTYTVTVTNDGNVTLEGITVDDPMPGLVKGDEWAAEYALNPGESVQLTATYEVTQSDIDASAEILNAATATAPDPTDPTKPPVTDEDEETVVPETQTPDISVEKVATGANVTAAGQTITYIVSATNTGNVTLNALTLADDKAPANVKFVNQAGEVVTSVAPGETVTATYEYAVTQDEMDAGKVENIATVTGTTPPTEENPNGTETTDSDDEDVTTAEDPENPDKPVIEQNASISVDKAAANVDVVKAGDEVTYTVTVTNTGNVTVKNITFTDTLVDLSDKTIESLAPGKSAEITYTYVATQADIDAGNIHNVVTATAPNPTDPGDDPENPKPPVTATDDEDINEPEDPENPDPNVPEIIKNGHLTVHKETISEPANGEAYDLGETIQYQISVENDGNLTITDVYIYDEMAADQNGKHSWYVESLAPGETTALVYVSHVVTEADILAGNVHNVAVAKGTSPDPNVPDVPVTPGTEDDDPVAPNGELTIVKVATNEPADGIAFQLGEEIFYEITVTNTGNLTITDITVTDELTGDEWTIESLAPNGSEKFTASYVVTEADIVNGAATGNILNVATATGTSPDPENPPTIIPGEDPEPVVVPGPALFINKTVTNAPANGVAFTPGETIQYRITATNNGNVTLTNVVVRDRLTGDRWTVDMMAPGEKRTFTASHTVTAADVAAGNTVVNVATATATPPEGVDDPVINPGRTVTPVAPNPPAPVVPAVPTTVVNDNPNSLGPTPTPIEDEENPLSGFDEPWCWVHWWIALGILVTLAYGLAVSIRRKNYIARLDEMDDDAMGRDAARAGAPANVTAAAKEA